MPGPSRLVYNNLERLLSNDPNRAQAFLAAALADGWRAAAGEQRANWRFYPGVGQTPSTLAAPIVADVYSGLMVRPDAPSYLLVDAGVAGFVDPTQAGPDDSPYLLVRDPGVSAPGVLPFTSNATPSTVRWDVVECQPSEVVLEQSSRDVFNPSTGLFVPALLDKVRAARLNYRIRLGTPGSGFPGSVAGWLPLAVVAVRDGALGFHQCDVYDVRPLVAERVRPQPVGLLGNEGVSLLGAVHYSVYNGRVAGYAEAEFNGYLAGGALRCSAVSPSVAAFGASAPDSTGAPDGAFLELFQTFNQGGSFSFSTSSPSYVVALFPFVPGQGCLPRWARYSEGPDPTLGRRVPNGPRGILCITNLGGGDNGLYNAVLPFPATMQMGGVYGAGVVLGPLSNNGSGGVLSATFAGRRYQHTLDPDFNQTSGSLWILPGTPGTPTLDDAAWILPNYSNGFPINAKALIASFRAKVSQFDNHDVQFNVASCVDGIEVASANASLVRRLDTSVVTEGLLGPISIPRPFPAANAVGSWPLAASLSQWSVQLRRCQGDPPGAGSGGMLSATMYIHGWEF